MPLIGPARCKKPTVSFIITLVPKAQPGYGDAATYSRCQSLMVEVPIVGQCFFNGISVNIPPVLAVLLKARRMWLNWQDQRSGRNPCASNRRREIFTPGLLCPPRLIRNRRRRSQLRSRRQPPGHLITSRLSTTSAVKASESTFLPRPMSPWLTLRRRHNTADNTAAAESNP